jgi:superfamily I DNA/RNA helicase
MAFDAYLFRSYEHSHEAEMFTKLIDSLHQRFANFPGKHILIGNPMINGHDIDALFLKSTGICIVEMKAHGGKILFRENTPWLVGGQEVKGGAKINPFLQVRTYRFGLHHFLRDNEREILQGPRVVRWDHVAGMVVFGQPIQFEDQALNGLRTWFGITDLERVAEKLALLGSNALSLTVREIESLLALLGLNDSYRCEVGAAPLAPPKHSNPPKEIAPPQLVYLKEFPFRDILQQFSLRAGARSQGAQRVRELFEQVRSGLDPFAALPNRTDSRVESAFIYPLNSVTELILLRCGHTTYPAFVGEPSEVEGWISAHHGLLVTLDAATGRITVTRIMGQPDVGKLPPPALSTEVIPFLTRLPGLPLEELVPARITRQHLLELDETSSDEDIRERLELISDSDLRAFLFDIISLIRGGDHASAEARLRLRQGEALPVEDAGEFAQDAAASGINSDQALVINALPKEELDRLLDPRRFQDWMLFLHPDQKHMAEGEFDRPVVLTGVSGSGKTCILVHRARHLARKYPGQRIGILTLSRTLAGLLRNLAEHLLSDEERANVHVVAFYDVFRDCLKHFGPDKYFSQLAHQVESHSHMHTVLERAREKWPLRMVWDCDPISQTKVEEEWEEFYMSRNPNVKEWMDDLVKYLESYRIDASRYLEEEFTLIRSAFAVPNRTGYLDTEDRSVRSGRCIEMRKDRRADALRLLLFWEEWLLAGGMIDNLGLTQALMPLHSEMQGLPESLRFRCLLVDEFQDCSTLDLQLLRRFVPITQPDALFLAGDTVQKILVKKLSMGGAALDRGPALHRSIQKNYRNSKQVLMAASRLANHYGTLAKAQGEEIEVLNPELAHRETNPPIVLKTDHQITKAWEIALECTQNQRTEPWTVCIASASPKTLSVAEILRQRPHDLEARPLSGDCILHPEQVVVGTLHDLKGFEFRLVLIVGCDAGTFPETGVPREEVWRDALRLYVAMTRGRDQVYLLHGETPSEFTSVFDTTVVYREESVLRPYQQANTDATSPPSPQMVEMVSPHSVKLSGAGLDIDGRCESWFSTLELEALHKYFARHVYRDGLTFHEWLRPEGMRTISIELFYRVPRCTPTIVSAVITKLRAHGIELRPPNQRNRHRP